MTLSQSPLPRYHGYRETTLNVVRIEVLLEPDVSLHIDTNNIFVMHFDYPPSPFGREILYISPRLFAVLTQKPRTTG